MTAYWRIETPTNPIARLVANHGSERCLRRKAIAAAPSVNISKVNVGMSVMKVGASGPHKGPTTIVTATNTAHHTGRTTCRPMNTTPSRPTSPSIAVKSSIVVMLRSLTAAIGATIAIWPTSVIDTQPLNESVPESTHRKRVRR